MHQVKIKGRAVNLLEGRPALASLFADYGDGQGCESSHGSANTGKANPCFASDRPLVRLLTARYPQFGRPGVRG